MFIPAHFLTAPEGEVSYLILLIFLTRSSVPEALYAETSWAPGCLCWRSCLSRTFAGGISARPISSEAMARERLWEEMTYMAPCDIETQDPIANPLNQWRWS
ncbi:hypothetical protein K470DRAFT_95994 [Piedraia hortae CBS 480.64]|uniref:Uncharacterized protein n=1 Tax=Piedraia hortae CBS 480.64 TaxID=1314780 RepID=A0A6A7BX36_9PEZI|nr:hypothetical protein K470DRAFT_95994 [Piedraia hortae CBS 480.64]